LLRTEYLTFLLWRTVVRIRHITEREALCPHGIARPMRAVFVRGAEKQSHIHTVSFSTR
jgi:hypothetical protein